jgi:hypothetical protein
MKAAPRLLCAILLTVACGAARADRLRNCYISGIELAQCAATWERVFHNDDRLPEAGTAWQTANFEGFVMAVATLTDKRDWCPTGEIPSNQIFAVVASFLREHPERWGEKPTNLIVASLRRTAPCAQPSAHK